VSNGCTSHCQVFELPRVWRDCFTFLHLKFVGFLVLLTISGCTAHVVWLYFSSSNISTSSWMTGLFCFFVLSILSGCTVPNGCTSYRQAFELLLKWRDYFIFSTFVFCLFSCTFYIKWVVLLMWNGCTSPRHIFEGAHSLHIKRNIWKIKDEVCTLLCELLLDILLFILHFTKNFALSKLIICPSSSHHLYFSES
jgi:hypothetical protein